MLTTRNTKQKETVLQTVRKMHTHPTADEIFENITKKDKSVSRATVYRILSNLSGQNTILRVSNLNAADRFDFQVHPHYHFRCTSCDKVFDVDLPYKGNLIDEVSNSEGFLIKACNINFSGLCNKCKENE